MALLRRLLALSCDRHMRNATAVSALTYAVVVLLAARRRCCAVCWPSHAIGTCEMPARAAAAAGLASERLRRRSAGSQQSIAGHLLGAAWRRCCAVCWPSAAALLRRLLALSCDRHMRNACEGCCSCWSRERKAVSSVCWQPAIDCRPSAGYSSEPMALLRRLLALSCDRHMRNATAVSALTYAVVVLLAARRRCCAVCWPSHAIGTCEMPARTAAAAGLASERLRRRSAGSQQSIAGHLLGAVVSQWRCCAVCWPSHAIGTCEVLLRSRLSHMRSSFCWQRGGAAAPSVGPLMRSAHAKCLRGRLQLLVSRAKGCVVGLLAASNRLQAICWVQRGGAAAPSVGPLMRSAHAKCLRGRLQLLVSRAKGCVVGLLTASNRLQAICWVQ